MKTKGNAFLILLFISLFLAAAAGCGSGQPAAGGNAPADENAATRVYTDATGREVEIPVNPQRVVTTQYLDAMLALGIKPLGAPTHVLDNNYLGELQEGVVDLGSPFQIEKVLELEPDLILSANPEEVEQLSKIAPTVVVPWMYGDVFAQFKEIAKVLNREQEAEQWMARLEAKAAEGRTKLAGTIGQDEVVTIFMAYGKDVLRIYGGRNVGHTIYRSLQLTPPPFIQEKLKQDPDFKEFVFEQISMEKLPEYAGDRIIMLIYDQAAKDAGGMFHQIEQSPIWNNLDAVKNNRVYYVDVDPWFAYSPLAIEQSLEQAIDLLSK